MIPPDDLKRDIEAAGWVILVILIIFISVVLAGQRVLP